jgi:hypothetical protein
MFVFQIFCAVFSEKWIGYCIQVGGQAQIHALYDKALDQRKVQTLGISVACKIDEALEQKGHKKEGFDGKTRMGAIFFKETIPNDCVAVVYFFSKIPR